MQIGSYTREEFRDVAKSFHGSMAPGILVGGVMVGLALSHLPEGEFFDAISETTHCLPDAIQLLTPCTTGNGWLKIVNLGRYALTMHEKYGGKGVRVFLDPRQVRRFSELNTWYMKLKEKRDQDLDLLLDQIDQAGSSICGVQQVQVKEKFLGRQSRGKMRLCVLCGEGYPAAHGGICRACQGEAPYEWQPDEAVPLAAVPGITTVAVESAVGRRVLHDMTQVVPGVSKGPAFKRGQVISAGDICRLQQMGRQKVYVEQDLPEDPLWVHENPAAEAFSRAMAGDGVEPQGTPCEGKVDLLAARDGLLVVETDRMEMFNLVPGVMCASRQEYSVVKTGRKIAGTRAIPLFLPRSEFEKAMAILREGPLFRVTPLRRARVGILVTGTEVFRGLVEDRFIPILRNKIEKLDSEVVGSSIVPDEFEAIVDGVRDLLDRGIDLLVTTAGLSVDPDDVTRQGLIDAGATDLVHGAPVLPGAMTLLAHIGPVQVLGVPACALYFKTTAVDLLLPRLLAGVDITRRDLAALGHGGLCLECKSCTYPKCPFGKG